MAFLGYLYLDFFPPCFCCILLQCSVMGLVQKVRLVTEVVVLNVPNF